MNAVVRWAFSITAFLLFASLWEELFPKQRDRKYIRFFWELLFLLIVLKPVAGWFCADEWLEEYVKAFETIWNEEAVPMIEEEEAQERIEQAVLTAYEEQVENETRKLAQEVGYTITQIEAECARDSTGAEYGILIRVEGKARTDGKKESGAVPTVKIPQILVGTEAKTEGVLLTELSGQIAQHYQLESGQVQIWEETE